MSQQQMSPTAEQSERLIQFLDKSRTDLHCALDGLDDQVCAEKPDDDAWSIKGIVEHLSILEKRVVLMLQTKLATAELAPELEVDLETRDETVVRRTVSRTRKFSASEPLQPKGKYASCREALDAFDTARQSTIAYVKSTPPFLRGRFLPHLAGVLLDGYQWLLLLAAHTERHIQQIEETKQALLNAKH